MYTTEICCDSDIESGFESSGSEKKLSVQYKKWNWNYEKWRQNEI